MFDLGLVLTLMFISKQLERAVSSPGAGIARANREHGGRGKDAKAAAPSAVHLSRNATRTTM